MPGKTRLLPTFVLVKALEVVRCLMLVALCNSFTLPMFSEVCWLGGVWIGFQLSRVRGQPVPCRFCGGADGHGHLFGECTCPPPVEIRENPEFHDLVRVVKGHWPRSLLWHGWLPLLSGTNGDSPWAETAVQGAGNLLEQALGS